jgi:hypothetical protein
MLETTRAHLTFLTNGREYKIHMNIKILVSTGEILDKYSILLLKQQYCNDTSSLNNIRIELQTIQDIVNNLLQNINIINLYNKLYETNHRIWHVEDAIRKQEKLQKFDSYFIELARSVYLLNDERARIKKQINILSDSHIIEEKIYETY